MDMDCVRWEEEVEWWAGPSQPQTDYDDNIKKLRHQMNANAASVEQPKENEQLDFLWKENKDEVDDIFKDNSSASAQQKNDDTGIFDGGNVLGFGLKSMV